MRFGGEVIRAATRGPQGTRSSVSIEIGSDGHTHASCEKLAHIRTPRRGCAWATQCQKHFLNV